MTPCYRVCIWCGTQWRPFVTRTRNLLRTLRQVKQNAKRFSGFTRSHVWVERRPGKLIPMPLPTHPGPTRELKIFG